MAQIAYETSDFRRDYRKASKQGQDKIDAFIRKFDEEASRPGTDLKTPKRAADSRVKTARVDQGLRAVLLDTGNAEYALVRVMEHDAAYRIAETLRPDVSSFNGLPRILHLGQASAPQKPLATRPPIDLVGHRSNEDFELVGVSPFIALALRGLPDRDAIEAFADVMGETDPLLGLAIHGLLDPNRTVDEIFDELVAVDGGAHEDLPRKDGVWNGLDANASTERYDTNDLASALARPGAAERFRLVEDSEELVQALKGDFVDWQVFLHPLQRQAAYGSYTGPARVSGGAGTGKTVVLLHRVKALLDRGDPDDAPRILLATYTTHLQQDLSRLLVQLVGEGRASEVEIQTVDGLARTLHHQMTGTPPSPLSSEEEMQAWRRIAADHDLGWTATFLHNEYRHVLLARSVRSLEQYVEVTRTGRGIRLTELQRRALWPAFESFDAETRATGRLTTLQLTETVAALVERLPSQMYDHVLVDEAQDLHASQWRLLRAVVGRGPDDLMVAGDALQRIYGDTVSLRSLGIETRGRSVRLRRNYRTTHEIIGWALGVVGDEAVVDIDDLGTNLSGYHSVRHGPSPQFAGYDDPAAELDGLADIVGQWISSGHDPESVAITARTPSELAAIVTRLHRANIPAAQMGRRGRLPEAVNVATMHRVKGLEYACVAVTGLSAQCVPPLGAVCPAEDDLSQHLSDLQTERSLIYVAATRARDELSISWHGAPTSLISLELTNALAATEGIEAT
jgi:hypothetical protein